MNVTQITTNEECLICFYPPNEQPTTTYYGHIIDPTASHIYCGPCLIKIFGANTDRDPQCPSCQQNITNKNELLLPLIQTAKAAPEQFTPKQVRNLTILLRTTQEQRDEAIAKGDLSTVWLTNLFTAVKQGDPREINDAIDIWKGEEQLSLCERISLVWAALCNGHFAISWDLLFYGKVSIPASRDQ